MLTDADLVEIVRTSPPAKQVAVASRETLSTAVTGAIAEFAVTEAVERALANDNAAFDVEGLDTVIRDELPVAVTEKLVSLVAGEMFDHLVNNHELPPQIAIDLAMGARERVTIDIVEQAAKQGDIGRFVQQLNLNGRLSPSLLMRGLCLGHIEFVEHAMAELAGTAHQRMWLMIHDSGPLGLKAAFDRAGLPPRLFPSFRAAIEVYHSVERECATIDRETFRQRMLERALTLFQSVPKDDLEYLLEKLDATGRSQGRAAAG